ncbi:MAG: metallophosphoesterase [Verrucomicrobiota bacterium]
MDGAQTGRTLAVGDIHGCLDALEALANFAKFRPEDRLITLGDVIDRGPNSNGVIEWLMARAATEANQIHLLGNHELMILEAKRQLWRTGGWILSGGQETLDSYAKPGSQGSLDSIPDEHWEWMKAGLPFHETDTHIFVHAGVHPNKPLTVKKQPESKL